MDQNITSVNNPPDLFSLSSTARKRKYEQNVLDEEEIETEVFKRIKEELTSLPLALQSMVIEWDEGLLSQKDFMQTKKILLQNQHHSNTLANSVFLTFKLRASKNLRDVFNNEQTNLYTIIDATKRQASNLFSKFIL